MSSDAMVAAGARSDPVAAFTRLGRLGLFALLPAATVATMFVIAVRTGPLAWDFRNELYPQAEDLLAGRNPYPEALWPPLAAVVAMPFTVLPSEAAGVAFALAGLGCMALALWVVGVRDWRVYGVVGLWPPVLSDVRIAHLTPLLCLLAALVWRYRDRPVRSGAALGLAGGLKFFLWPLGVWLLATRRAPAAVLGAVVAVASLIVVVAFTALDDYLTTLRHVTEFFDQDSYALFGMLVQLGASDTAARVVAVLAGAFLLLLTWRLRSFTLAVAAALTLSPIVWFDFYALAAVPLAIARPRWSVVWLLPVLTWGLPSSGIDTDPLWGIGRVLVVFGTVLWVAALAETRAVAGRTATVS